MNEKIQILLNKARTAESVNENAKIDINIDNTNRLIPLNDISTTVSAFQQFVKERKESTIYRFYGAINAVVSNPLYNDNVRIFSGITVNGPGIVGKKVRSHTIFEKDGWIGYFSEENNPELEQYGDNKSSLCDFIPFDPGYNRLQMLDSDGKPNYMLKITYPYTSDTISLVQDSGSYTLADGIPVIEKITILVGGRRCTGFKTPINHGLKPEDGIRLIGFGDTSPLQDEGILILTKIWNVYKLGNESNDQQSRIFVLDIDPANISFSFGKARIKRVSGIKTPNIMLGNLNVLLLPMQIMICILHHLESITSMIR